MRLFKKIASLLLIVATLSLFLYYILRHPQLLQLLSRTPPYIVLLILFLYGVMQFVLTLYSRYGLKLNAIIMPLSENVILTNYSTLINFFGPLQSGPGFRAAYLKRKYHLSLRQFFKATVIGYGFFILLSACMVLMNTSWWPLGVLLICTVLMGAGVGSLFVGKLGLQQEAVVPLALATVLQLVVISTIYWVELATTGAHPSIPQALSYTGTANLALFVSITPGALGIREAFLLFTEKINHLTNTQIIAASTLDRAVFLVFLGILFGLVVVFHAKERFIAQKVTRQL